jgi:hypothetical protein
MPRSGGPRPPSSVICFAPSDILKDHRPVGLSGGIVQSTKKGPVRKVGKFIAWLIGALTDLFG